MPDDRQVARLAVERAKSVQQSELPESAWLDMVAQGSASDSMRAAEQLSRADAGCIIVLGGDGTVRVVSKAAGTVPLLPISTGTNNVLPAFIEATVAGLAAGAVAHGRMPLETLAYRHKWLEISIDGRSAERALVDVAVIKGNYVGARAVWSAEGLIELVVTRADPATIGMSAIAGVLRPIDAREPLGLAVSLKPQATRQILALLGPGLTAAVGIQSMRELAIGDELELRITEPVVVALDGEREFSLTRGQHLVVRLREDGPWIVDSQQVMRELVISRFLDIRRVNNDDETNT